MKKKTIIIFMTILLILGISNIKVYASTEVNAEPLELLVSVKCRIESEDGFIEEWRKVGINKYKLGEKVLYRTSGNLSDVPIQNELDNVVIFRIIRNGYNQIEGNKLGMQSENDAYMATQLAIDYIERYFNVTEIDNTYKVANGLSEEQSQRATRIIEKAKELVRKGFDSEENYKGKAEILEIGEMQKEEGYVSQIYKTEITDGKLLGYNIEANADYSTADAETGEVKVEFDADEELFKVMIPNNQAKKLDTLKINANVSYITNKIYERADNIGRFAMLSEAEETDDIEVVLINTMQNIDFGDESTSDDKNTGGNTQEEPEKNDEKSEEIKDAEESEISSKENEAGKKDETNQNSKDLKDKEKTENIDKSNEEKNEENSIQEIQRKVLPRTGEDYFNLKLILINLSLFIIFLGIKFIVLKNKKSSFATCANCFAIAQHKET